VFGKGKFLAIFSLLFGAGIVLFSNKAEISGQNSVTLHYRRMGWLLLFGLMHSYLLWTGDILVAYSLCGMLIFLFRKKKPLTLMWMSLALLMVPVLIYLVARLSMPYWPPEISQLAETSWKPDEASIQKYLEMYRCGWIEQMSYRVPSAFSWQTRHFVLQTFWRVSGMMLLGMALYKWEVLSAGRSKNFYLRMTILGFSFGLLLTIPGVVLSFKSQWSVEFARLIGSRMNYVGSLGMAMAYTGIIMLISQSTKYQRFKRVFASVGRMAFSNYILMTLLGTFLFYGHGLGLYGSVDRTGQMGIVLLIWALMLIISPLWLKHFQYGPLEALWRKLTYKKSDLNKNNIL
jgi:uncharacterized protein